MLNKTLKLIRLTIGYTTTSVALESGYSLTYILKLENSDISVSKKLMKSLSNIYDIPTTKIREISTLQDYGYTRAGIISEISDYYIKSGQTYSIKKYVSEEPEILVKLIRIVTGQTLDNVASIVGITEQKISALESFDLDITIKDHYNLAKAFDMTKSEMDKLINMYENECSRVELLSEISEYYVKKETTYQKVKTKSLK